MQADDSLIGCIVADRYQVLSRLGEGGMGRVYLAEHVRMGRKCALKVISPALATTADAISRFNREAANAAKINHPNVAQIYDFGESDGILYIAMEYIEGETLDAIVSRDSALAPARAAQIAKQIADALHAAHHLGIVHRDLKPENVMIARHLDGTDWVKVVDFGIAKTVQRDGAGSQTVTTAGVSLGTPEFMSPEQLAGEQLDHRTDIYSLGLVLFTALTGELPYPRVTSKETLVKRLISRPRTLAEVRPSVDWPAALQEVLDRALAPELADRYDNVAELGRDVVQAVSESPMLAAAPTVVSRLVPRPASAPRRKPDGAPVSRALLRRAVPLAALAAVVIFGAAMALARQALPHRAPWPPIQHDTTAALAIVQQASAAPPAIVLPSPVPDSAAKPSSTAVPALDRKSSKPARHSEQSVVPNAKPAPKPRTDTVAAPRQTSPDTSATSRSAAAATEVRTHIARMKERFETGDMRGARQELGEAASMLSILRDLDPDPQHVTTLQRELGQGVRELVADCYRMRADSTLPRGVRCENLGPAAGRFREFRRQR